MDEPNNLTINGNISVNSQNIALGFQAGFTNQGTSGVAVGYNSGYNQSGANNTFLGYQAGYDGGVARTGASNTCIGSSTASGTLTAGNNNTCLGAGATINNASYYNSTAIGVGATATNNSQIKLGTTSETVSIPGSLSAAGITCSTINTQNNTISYGSGSISGTGAITANSINLNGSGAIVGIRSGTGGSASGVGPVCFGFTFAVAPVVVGTIINGGNNGNVTLVVVFSSITTTGCNFTRTYTNAGSYGFSNDPFNWIAICL